VCFVSDATKSAFFTILVEHLGYLAASEMSCRHDISLARIGGALNKFLGEPGGSVMFRDAICLSAKLRR
jgi:hypothetical protein